MDKKIGIQTGIDRKITKAMNLKIQQGRKYLVKFLVRISIKVDIDSFLSFQSRRLELVGLPLLPFILKVAFLCANNVQTEKEITKVTPFTVASKINKQKLTKEVKDLHSEN